MSAARHPWIASLALAACAAPVTYWEKPGATPAMVQEDSDQCRIKAKCMQERGYSARR